MPLWPEASGLFYKTLTYEVRAFVIVRDFHPSLILAWGPVSESLQMSSNQYVAAGFAGQWVLNKNLTVWLNRAKSPPKYICKDIKINKKMLYRFVGEK